MMRLALLVMVALMGVSVALADDLEDCRKAADPEQRVAACTRFIEGARLARAAHAEDEAIPLGYVLAKVEEARKLRLVILDACRDNPFLARMEQAGGVRTLGRGLGRIEPERGILVAYAARDGQLAQDGDKGHSPFTRALLDHIEEPGLEIGLLFRKVRDTVLKGTGGAQEPYVYGSLPSEGLFFKAVRQ